MFIKKSEYEKLVADRDDLRRGVHDLLKITVSLWKQKKLLIELVNRIDPETGKHLVGVAEPNMEKLEALTNEIQATKAN